MTEKVELDDAEVTQLINNNLYYNYQTKTLTVNHVTSGKLFSFLSADNPAKVINIGPFKGCRLTKIMNGDPDYDKSPLYIRRVTFIVGNIEAPFIADHCTELATGEYYVYLYNHSMFTKNGKDMYGIYLTLTTTKTLYSFLIDDKGKFNPNYIGHTNESLQR